MTVRTNAVRPEEGQEQQPPPPAGPTRRVAPIELPAGVHGATVDGSRPASSFYGVNLSAIFSAAVGGSGRASTSNEEGLSNHPHHPDPLTPNSYNVLDVLHVLTDFRQNHERLKLYRVSLSVIRFLSVLNFVYTVLGVTFLLLALCTEWTPEFDDKQRAQFFKIGERRERFRGILFLFVQLDSSPER